MLLPGAGQFTTWQFKGLWQNFKHITHLNSFRTVTRLDEGHSSNDVWWACLVWGLVDNLCQLYAFWHDPLHWHWSAYIPAVLFVCMMLCKSICYVHYTLHLYHTNGVSAPPMVHSCLESLFTHWMVAETFRVHWALFVEELADQQCTPFLCFFCSAVLRQLIHVVIHSCNLCSCIHVHAMTITCIDYS